MIWLDGDYNYSSSKVVITCVKIEVLHWEKSVRIRSFSGPYFPTFGLNTER